MGKWWNGNVMPRFNGKMVKLKWWVKWLYLLLYVSSSLCNSTPCSMVGDGIPTRSMVCRDDRTYLVNCYLSTKLSRHIFYQVFLLLLYWPGSFQGYLKFDSLLLQPVHEKWWSLNTLHIPMYTVYHTCYKLLGYCALSLSNIRFDRPQSFLLQSLLNGWV